MSAGGFGGRHGTGGCTDLGVGSDETRWRQLHYLPVRHEWRQPAPAEIRRLSDQLRAELTRLQTAGDGCGSLPLHTVAELPMIGFCATIEYGLLALARSASSGARLVLGHRSAPTWSSQWLCAGERSLGCYFNVSSACCPEQSSFDIGVSEGARHAFMPGKLATKMKRIGGRVGSCTDISSQIRLLSAAPWPHMVQPPQTGTNSAPHAPSHWEEPLKATTYTAHSGFRASSRTGSLGECTLAYGVCWMRGELACYRDSPQSRRGHSALVCISAEAIRAPLARDIARRTFLRPTLRRRRVSVITTPSTRCLLPPTMRTPQLYVRRVILASTVALLAWTA